MRVTYVGPLDAVELVDLHQVVVQQGDTIEVADELGARLVEQRCWDTSEAEVIAWVGDDPDRAARLLEAERNGAQRVDLVARLELIATRPGEDGQVPAGTAEEVLAWVGDDVDRAQRALVAELSGKNRSGLTAQLQRLSTKEGD
ncbi:MAG TPA: hypothetical protein VGX25_04025 [Actinophytocola sp.]|uniref:hypothetical protein n=1 Tax=Actinophytocola sp. TaxID=1872138 RepID=UPI002DDDBC6F|nr:hypothetical protein [Actinophytocola sp.]HEV2778546.1 hypothetical protein [Actinophytocola sp.]